MHNSSTIKNMRRIDQKATFDSRSLFFSMEIIPIIIIAITVISRHDNKTFIDFTSF